MSNYQIVFTRSAFKELDSLPAETKSRIEPKINGLVTNPRPPGCLKLTGTANDWRIRVGDYRVIYSIDDSNHTIDIISVRHRREIYDR